MMFKYSYYIIFVLSIVQFIMYPNSVDSFPYGQQTAKPRFTDQVDWAKVNDGIYDPTNIAIHNGQRFINFVSGSVGWLIVSLLYSPQYKQVRSSTRSLSETFSIDEPINDNSINSWYTYDGQDTTQLHKRLKRNVLKGDEEKPFLQGDKLNSVIFDPKTKLVKMVRSFADAVEKMDWQYDEV